MLPAVIGVVRRSVWTTGELADRRPTGRRTGWRAETVANCCPVGPSALRAARCGRVGSPGGRGGAGDARPSIRRTGVRSSKNLGQKNRCSDGSRRSARRASSWRSSLRLSSTRPKAGGKVDLTVGTAFESVSEVRASTASCNCRGCGSPDPVHGVIDSTPRVRSPSGLRRRAHRSQRSSATPRRRRRARP